MDNWPHDVDHRCPICGNWHDGRYQLCGECVLKQEEEDEDAYDYTTDDFNSEVRRGR